MKTQNVGYQPQFTSKAILTKGLRKVLNAQKTSGNRNAVLELVKNIENDGLNRTYKLGYRLRDDYGKSLFNMKWNMPIERQLYIKVSENFDHAGASFKVTYKHQTPLRLKELNISNCRFNKPDLKLLEYCFDNANSKFENKVQKVKAAVEEYMAKYNEKVRTKHNQ